MHFNEINYSFNIEYIFIYLINPILNIYNLIFLNLSLKFYLIIYVFFYKNEVVLVYKLN